MPYSDLGAAYFFLRSRSVAAAANGLDGAVPSGMRNASPHSEQRTRLPRTLSGTRRMARHVSLGQIIVMDILARDHVNAYATIDIVA